MCDASLITCVVQIVKVSHFGTISGDPAVRRTLRRMPCLLEGVFIYNSLALLRHWPVPCMCTVYIRYVCSFGRNSCLFSEAVSFKLLMWEACFDKEYRQQNVKKLSFHISFLAGYEQRAWTRSPCCQVRHDTYKRRISHNQSLPTTR